MLAQILQRKELKYYLLKNKLSELPDDSPNIVNKSNIDRYTERSSATFCNGKYSILEDFCYGEFLAYCTPENKSSKTCAYQPDKLDDNLIEDNHEKCSYSPQKNR